MSSTALEVRSTLDLTRSPSERWNQQMLDIVSRNVFRGKEITQQQLYYCLAVAEAVNLNPLVGEVYFIPGKSRDGQGPAWIPYVGRNGLVKKATERAAYYESDTVHEHDKFRMARKADGTVVVTHSYGSAERGEIVGAYAFLHFRNGDKPAFFYAKLSEYLPSFDQDWKMQASPWGNQRSAMIEKCAMIGAGRKRLDLGNVLADGELDIVAQMGEIGPGAGARSSEPAPEFDFASLTDDAGLAERLRLATSAVGWPAAKAEMILSGMSRDDLLAQAEALEAEAELRPVSKAPAGAEGSGEGGASEPSGEPIADAEVVSDAEHVEALRKRKTDLEDLLNEPDLDEHAQAELQAEFEHVDAELAAAENPDQLSL